MTTLTSPTSPLTNGVQAAPAVWRKPYRLTTEQYHRMIAAGILGEDDPVELLEGTLVEKMAHNPPHASMVAHADEVIR